MAMNRIAMNRLESKIEEYFVDQVESVLHGVALKLEVKGRRGWLDRIAVLPFRVTVYVELKAENGRLSRLQKQRIKELEAMGHAVQVLLSKRQIDVWVDLVKGAQAVMAEVTRGEMRQ